MERQKKLAVSSNEQFVTIFIKAVQKEGDNKMSKKRKLVMFVAVALLGVSSVFGQTLKECIADCDSTYNGDKWDCWWTTMGENYVACCQQAEDDQDDCHTDCTNNT